MLARIALLLALAASPALAQPTPCAPKISSPPLVKAGELLGAINPTVAPIQYIDENGKLMGLDVEFGNMIAERLCLKMVFQSTQFATMIPLLRDGRIDMIDSFMFYTPERAAQVMMIPYGASTLAIVAPKANQDAITGPEYFSGKKFAAELGSVDLAIATRASEALVQAGKPGIDVHSFSTYADVLQALAAGQVDGAFVGTEQAIYYRKKGVTFFRIALAGYDPHAEALAFSNPEIAKAVTDAINAMKADGSFDKLFAGYGHCTLPGDVAVHTGALEQPTCKPPTD